MAYYKVPQDVEAEDKLVFGLTFKQFIFAIVFFVTGFLGFQVAKSSIVWLGPILPVFLISGVLAFYKPKDQSVETKLVAYVNYFFRPRRRIWSRDGQLEHVIIQAPPAPERTTFVRSEAEVHSQLKNLAQIVDTRGWSVKHSEIQLPTASGVIVADDRLIAPREIQAAVAPPAPPPGPPTFDIFDEKTNPAIDNFKQLTDDAKQREHEHALAAMAKAQKTPQSSATAPTPGSPHFQPWPTMHQKVVQPGAEVDPAVERQLSQLSDNDGLPVSVIAKEAQRLTSRPPAEELEITH